MEDGDKVMGVGVDRWVLDGEVHIINQEESRNGITGVDGNRIGGQRGVNRSR